MGKRWAYYNEKDPSAAEWIRELIKEKVITDGEVDERDIRDVVPADLDGFGRCHFFAGIGVWDYALTQAGWPDDREVWTGSCPCQPFSAAGKGEGFADERHLWPAWFHLIEQCRPSVIFGEQVSSKDTLPWIDLVHADLEGALYTVAATDLCSPSVGAPHIRQRLYFVADAGCGTSERNAGSILRAKAEIGRENGQLNGNSSVGFTDGRSTHELAKPVSVGRRGRRDGDSPGDGGEIQIEGRGGIGQLGNAIDAGLQGRLSGRTDAERETFDGHTRRNGPTNGFWRDAEWIYCRDGKWRPVGTVKSGTFAMADVSPDDLGYLCDKSVGSYTISPLIEKSKARVMRLRGYGNAIVAEVAVAFIKSYMESEEKVR